MQSEITLRRITNKIRESLDETQILQTTLRELTLALATECCVVSFYNLDTYASQVITEYGYQDGNRREPMIYMNEHWGLYKTLLRGEALQFCATSYLINRPASIVFIPLMNGDQPLGDIWVINPASRSLDDTEMRLVQQVVAQCAIALRQARLYQATQVRATELERMNQLKDDFLSTVSHELRSPISNMRLAIHLLEQLLVDERSPDGISVDNPPDHPKATAYLKILRSECDREISLVNDLLDLQRLENDGQPVNSDIVCLQEWLPSRLLPQCFSNGCKSANRGCGFISPQTYPL